MNLTLTGATALTFPPVPVFITRATSTLFIVNDEQGGVMQFSPTALSFSEKQPAIPIKGLAPGFTVTRTGTNLASGVTVNYQVIGGTAFSGTHYTIPGGNSGTLTFAAGQTSLRIPVTIIDNGAADHDRTIVMGLSTPGGGGSLGTATQATLTIVDDEQEISSRPPPTRSPRAAPPSRSSAAGRRRVPPPSPSTRSPAGPPRWAPTTSPCRAS